jgi:hypothetical protein
MKIANKQIKKILKKIEKSRKTEKTGKTHTLFSIKFYNKISE